MHSKKPYIALMVTNDLVTDQRVDRIAGTLLSKGAGVLVIGRKLRHSPMLNKRAYKTKRLRLFFTKGPLFYLFFNFRLIIYLLPKKITAVVANDLDTLVAGFVLSKLKKLPLIYDSHEYFTEVPELQNRPFARNVWRRTEKTLVPHVKFAYTVCASIAREYKTLYGVDFSVVRNLPFKKQKAELPAPFEQLKNKKVIVYQGSINLGRGIEKAALSLKYLEDVVFLIIGRGDIEKDLKKLVFENNLTEKVVFTGVIPYEQLHAYTRLAHLGVSLEEDLGKNYRYALPNKIFDYIQAGVPVLVSGLPEMQNIVNTYNIGMVTNENDPEKLALVIRSMLFDGHQREYWLKNLENAAHELIWEHEKEILTNLYVNQGILA